MLRSDDFYKRIFASWFELMKQVAYSEEFNQLLDELGDLYKDKSIKVYPQQKDVFNAFRLTPLDKLSLVFITHQPYCDNLATGLAVSSDNDAIPMHRHTFKFFKTLEESFYNGLLLNPDFSLEHYAKQGIMFLNTALTTSNKGVHIDLWADFTRSLLILMSEQKRDIIYCFLDPQSTIFRQYIDEDNNKVTVTEDINSQNIDWKIPFKQIDNYITIKHNKKINW